MNWSQELFIQNYLNLESNQDKNIRNQANLNILEFQVKIKIKIEIKKNFIINRNQMNLGQFQGNFF